MYTNNSFGQLYTNIKDKLSVLEANILLLKKVLKHRFLIIWKYNKFKSKGFINKLKLRFYVR